MIEGKGLGNKKINRTNISLSNDYNHKLRLLAQACNKAHTTMAGEILAYCLDSPSIVYSFLDKYCFYESYRVRLVQHNGKVKYQVGQRFEQW